MQKEMISQLSNSASLYGQATLRGTKHCEMHDHDASRRRVTITQRVCINNFPDDTLFARNSDRRLVERSRKRPKWQCIGENGRFREHHCDEIHFEEWEIINSAVYY